METNESLTLEDVISCISFDPESSIYQTLKSFAETTFNIEKANGKTDHEAATVALEKLSKRIDRL